MTFPINDAAAFLRDHWQKKPLLIRNALPGFESPLSPEELAGLACEDGVEARLIQKGNLGFSLMHGPFNDDSFASLPKKDWTFLVQDVEKHLPDFAEYLDLFSFIPSWRIDDLMISCAAEGGGVGPHTDAYDVFLLQARGRRRWRIAESFNPTLIPDIDLKVLKDFEHEQEWILEPGDILYLPPNIAHDGVALDDGCMTYSIGCRAPALPDMFTDFAEWLQQHIPDDSMYTDPDLRTGEASHGEISPQAFTRARGLIHGVLALAESNLDHWFGRFVTEPKQWLRCEAPIMPLGTEDIRTRLAKGDELFKDTRALMAWRQLDGGAELFIDGEAWRLHGEIAPLLKTLCTGRHFSQNELNGYLDKEGLTLIARLYAHGALYFLEDEDR